MAEYLAENSKLRQLSRRFSSGQLSLDDFRAARRSIIEALESGQVDSSVTVAPIIPDAPVGSLPKLDDTAVFYKTMPPGSIEETVQESAGKVAEVAEETAETGNLDNDAIGEAVNDAPAMIWDGNTKVLAVILAVLLSLTIIGLIYVFAL